MSNGPIISIIIAACQARDFIAQAVQSALRQDIADIEILIAPDEPQAATDYAFLQSLDPRVRVLADVAAPTGPGLARNRALDVARGDFIALLDADDLWSPDYLAQLLPLAEQRGAAFGTTRIADWQGKVMREIRAKSDIATFADFAIAYGSLHSVTRRSPQRRWCDVLAEDVLFDMESLALCGGEAPFVADAAYQLRLRPHSMTRGDHFINEIGAGYDRLMAMVAAGETLIPPQHHAAARAVFRSWQDMNAAFKAAQAAGDRRAFQAFVAAI